MNFSKSAFTLLFSLLFGQNFAQGLSFDWVQTHGAEGYDRCSSVGTSQSGFIYSGGTFEDTVNFNPGGTPLIQISLGNTDGFLVKRDTLGTFQWATFFKGSGLINVEKVAVGANELISVVGSYTQDLQIIAGTNTIALPTVANETGYYLQFNASGQLLLHFQWETHSISQVTSVSTDSQGNFYIVGSFADSTNFDILGGNHYLTSTSSPSFADAFVAKYNASGVLIYVHQFGAQFVDRATDIAIDNQDNIVVIGTYRGTPDFNPGTGVNTLPSSGADGIFIAKYDPNGNLIFANGLPLSSGVGHIPGEVKIDENNNIYLCGGLAGNVDLDFGPGVHNVTGFSGRFVFYVKYDSNCNFLWGHSFGNSSTNVASSIVVDDANQVYLTGYYAGNMPVSDGNGYSTTMINGGLFDFFIARLDSSGNMLWTDHISAVNDQVSTSMALVEGKVFIGGYFGATTNFDPLGVVSPSSSNGLHDAFLVKYAGACTNSSLVVTSSANAVCDGDPVTISASGMDVITFNNGVVNNQPFVPSNTQTYIITGQQTSGAQCVVQQNMLITVNQPTFSTDVQTSCGPYTWIDGNLYTSSNNTASFTMTNANGCDSIISLNLTVTNVDITTINSDPILIANASNAAFQWLDCDANNALIVGATNATFQATVNGNYSVVVTQNGCSDTSTCLSVSSLSINELNPMNSFLTAYPNPSSGNYHVDFGNTLEEVEVEVRSISGSLVYTTTLKNAHYIDFEVEGPQGLYFLEVKQKNGSNSVIKLIKTK